MWRTDLSYAFANIYELLNNVGVTGPSDGLDYHVKRKIPGGRLIVLCSFLIRLGVFGRQHFLNGKYIPAITADGIIRR